MSIPLSLYIHIPWCVQKCPYCDFNSHGLKHKTLPETGYIKQLLLDLSDDIERFSEKRHLTSIFIGGGTPSLFSGQAIARLLDGIDNKLSISQNTEITLEANPGTVDVKHFVDYHQAGVNRLSIGIQSFNQQHLATLGRIHSPEQAKRAVRIARSAGFDNINIDLMFGLPQQSLAQALEDLEQGLALETEHLSYYQLTVEPNTAFAHQPPLLPGETTVETIFEQAQRCLQAKGFLRYEVSAWTRNRQAQHNLNYWQYGDYLGIGAGAHGKMTMEREGSASAVIIRTTKPRSPKQYLSASMRRHERLVPEKDKSFEFMLNALRLTDGFQRDWLKTRGLIEEKTLLPTLTALAEKELLELSDNEIKPTPLGQRFVNDMVMAFL